MEIQIIGSVAVLAEVVGAMAVIITIGYLAIQIRQSNRHAMLQSIQHTWSSMSGYCDLIAQSEELTSIVLKGRKSLDDLNENEHERFVHIHLRLLNNLECWLMMITESYPKGELRDHHLNNIDGIISRYFDYPGTIDFLGSMDSSWAMPDLYSLFLKNTKLRTGE